MEPHQGALSFDSIWRPADSMCHARSHHTATLLGTGKVLVAGGRAAGILSSVEVHDAAKGTWSEVAPMREARRDHVAALLAAGPRGPGQPVAVLRRWLRG